MEFPALKIVDNIFHELVKRFYDTTSKHFSTAINLRRNKTKFKKSANTQYFCNLCNTSTQIYHCNRCKLHFEDCICTDPVTNHYARHVAKMCKSCFDSIGNHDKGYLEIMAGLKELPKYLIVIRIIINQVLSIHDWQDPNSVEVRSHCHRSWKRLLQYITEFCDNYEDKHQELQISKFIKCFVFDEQPNIECYKPSTDQYIKQSDALMTDHKAREVAQFKKEEGNKENYAINPTLRHLP